VKCPVWFAVKRADKLAIAFLAIKFLSFQQGHVLRRKSNHRRANGNVTGREKIRRILQF
jgi:hypothetical protein